MLKRKISVALLGATGLVGQTYIKLLENHPYFDIKCLISSKETETYLKAVSDTWFYKTPIPKKIKDLPVRALSANLDLENCPLIFSALPSEHAVELDRKLVEKGHIVISHASEHRTNPLVPVIIPEININHLAILESQQKSWNTQGALIAKPNCSIPSFLLPLYAISKFEKPSKVVITTMQSLSGAGLKGLEEGLQDPCFTPFISGEEGKSHRESCKILGKISSTAGISSVQLPYRIQCMRIPTCVGHAASVYFELNNPMSLESIKDILLEFQSLEEVRSLPSTPKQIIQIHEDQYHPNSKDLSEEDMSIHVGRLSCGTDGSYRFVGLSNNLTRGAAGTALQTAEYLYNRGFF